MGDFICSQPDSSGMHKCSNLPPYVVDGKECSGSIETGLNNQERTTMSFIQLESQTPAEKSSQSDRKNSLASERKP